MQNAPPSAGKLSAIVLSLLFFFLPAVHAQGVLPLLKRPALISPEGAQSVLLDVAACQDRLVAVGERGHIVISTDNGATWRQKAVPVSVTLTGVSLVSPLVGWAVGHSGIVLKTTDGGQSWRKQLDGYQAAELFMQEVTARKATEGESERFTQLLTEAKMLLADGADKPFLDLCFADEKKGFIVGAYNLIFHTLDGGQTWLPWMSRTQNPGGYHMYRVLSVADGYYIAGELGLLMRSLDQGDTFKALASPYKGSYFGLAGLQNGELLAYGLRGNLFKSTDRGAAWTKVDSGTNASITDGITLKDGRLLLVTLAGEVLISHDRAHSFSRLDLKASFPFSAAAQAQNGDLVLVGARGVNVIAADRFTPSTDNLRGDLK